VTARHGRRPVHLLLAGGVLALALGLHACEHALLVEPSTPPVGGVALHYQLSSEDGFERAFRQVDEARIGVSRDGRTVLDTILELDAGGEAPSVHLELEVSSAEEAFSATLALAGDAGQLFQGDVDFVLRPGRTTTVQVGLHPVVSAVQVPDSLPVIDALNDTVHLAGAALFATGDPIPGAELVWSSLDPDVVEVSPDGILVSRGEGEAELVAESAGHEGSLTARVLGVVEAVSIEPSQVTVDLGDRVQLEAYVRDRRDNALPGRAVTWRAADPAVAAVDARGEVTGVAGGATTIFAESDGVTGSAAVTVVRPEVVTIQVSPSDPTLAVGETVQLFTAAFDASGTPVPGVRPSWSSSNPEIAELSSEGLVTAVTPGTTVVRARADDAMDEITVTVSEVVEGPTILTESLPGATLGHLYIAQLSVVGEGIPYRWSVVEGALPAGLALVESTGRIIGIPVVPGTASFTVEATGSDGGASRRGLLITVAEVVAPPPPPGAPRVTTTDLPAGTVGQSYTVQLGADLGVLPYSWSVAEGALPAGLALDGGTGRITGTPTAEGTTGFTVQVTGDDGLSSTRGSRDHGDRRRRPAPATSHHHDRCAPRRGRG
jgi:hypothetical protein